MGVTQSSVSASRGGLRGEAEPVAGTARLRPASATELSLSNRATFVDTLTQLGLGRGDRDEALRLRDEVADEVRILDDHYAVITRASYRFTCPPEAIAIAERRRAALQRLSDWFAARRFDVHATTTIEVRIPLFVVAAPAVAGCRGELRPIGIAPTALSGRVTLGGAGGGNGAVCHVTTSGAVGVRPGDVKAVFVPVNVAVSDVTVYDHGRQIGNGIQVRVQTTRSAVAPGVVLLAPDAIPTVGDLVHVCHGGAERIEVHAQPETRDVYVDFTVFGVEATITAAVSLTRPVVLDFDLAEGHEYDLHDLAHGFGIAWRTR